MATQIVMDRTGDSRHSFDPDNSADVAAAMDRFNDLVGQGYTAAERTGPGECRVVRVFDRTATEVLFFPRLKGG